MNYSWKDKKILIVEDTETSKRYFNAALNLTDVHLLWANNGEEAVDILRKNNDIHLVLMDIQMPRMNGLDATKEIRRFNSEIPIIIQSAFLMTGEEEKSYAAGANGFMSKPIKYHSLLNIIEEYLGK